MQTSKDSFRFLYIALKTSINAILGISNWSISLVAVEAVHLLSYAVLLVCSVDEIMLFDSSVYAAMWSMND